MQNEDIDTVDDCYAEDTLTADAEDTLTADAEGTLTADAEDTLTADNEGTLTADAEETLSAEEEESTRDGETEADNLMDPRMYETVNIVVTKGQKRKNGPNSQIESQPKKCRAVHGTEGKDLWCKPCRSKKKCTKFT